MRKCLTGLLSGVLLLSMLTGCGAKETETTEKTSEATTAESVSTGADASESDASGTDAALNLDGLDEIIIKYATVGPETGTSQADGQIVFKDYVESTSGGKIKVDMYYNGSLGGDVEMAEGCAMGSIEMSDPSLSVMTTYNEKFGILDMPFLFTNYESGLKALNEGELGTELTSYLEGTGIKFIGEFCFGGYRGLSNNVREVKTPADMSGLKIRVMESPVFIDSFTLLGANPTPMSFSELFSALQNGTVDGQDNDPSLTYTSQYYDVQKYYTNLEHVTSFSRPIVSEAWFTGLPEEYQTIIEDGINKMQSFITTDTYEKYNEYLQNLEDEGMTVTRLTDEERAAFKAIVEPMYEDYYDAYGQDLFDKAQEYN